MKFHVISMPTDGSTVASGSACTPSLGAVVFPSGAPSITERELFQELLEGDIIHYSPTGRERHRCSPSELGGKFADVVECVLSSVAGDDNPAQALRNEVDELDGAVSDLMMMTSYFEAMKEDRRLEDPDGEEGGQERYEAAPIKLTLDQALEKASALHDLASAVASLSDGDVHMLGGMLAHGDEATTTAFQSRLVRLVESLNTSEVGPDA